MKTNVILYSSSGYLIGAWRNVKNVQRMPDDNSATWGWRFKTILDKSICISGNAIVVVEEVND